MTKARTLPENLVIARSVQVAPDVACGTGFVPTSYETDFEPVTELHAYVDQQVRGTYSQQANSDFNAGFAPNGGGFSVNGTYHIGNSSGGGFSSPWLSPAAGHNAYGMWLETQFQYERGNMVQACGGLTKIVGQAIFPQEWQGGGIMSVDVSEWDGFDGNGQGFAHQPQSHISPFDPGFTPYRVDHRALDYGASIGAFGIGLGGSTGFSSTVRMDWVMGRAFPKYYLFGHDGDQLTAHVVYAY
jgi:hypothetical protein